MRRRDMLLGCAVLGVAGCGSETTVLNPAGAQAQAGTGVGTLSTTPTRIPLA